MATIGIDLGTTNSCVAIYEDGNAKIIPNREGKNTTPSIVAFTDKNEVLVGEAAKRQAITNPEKTIYSIKRIMGLMIDEEHTKDAISKVNYKIVDKNGAASIDINGTIYTPQEISAKILSKLKLDAETYLGETVLDAVITVPAYFNDAQRKATQEAGVIAGLNILRIVNEPTAASLAYGIDKKSEEKVLVYDLGGGTFDVTVLEIGDGTFEVLSTDGNAFLGGDDFDNRLIDFLIEEFKKEHNIDLTNDKMAMQRLKDEAEKAKKELSSSSELEINLPFLTADATGPKHLVKSITRAKFESMTEDLVEETLDHIKVALKDADINKDEINEIIMVGGSTRIPKVQEEVKNYFNKQLNNSVNPDEVVAAGAAIQGGVLTGDVKDVLLLDVTPLTLSIEVMGGISQPLIEKGTTIPVKKQQTFSTSEENQPQATIHVLQGEGKLASDNKSLGSFNADIEPAPRGVPQIEVTFDIDSNGVLNVSALDKTSGKKSDITISGSSGLSEDEIQEMINNAERDNKSHLDKVEAISKRNELDSLTYQIEKTIKEAKQDVDSVPGLSDLLNEAKELVSSQSEDKSKIVDTISKLEQLAQSLTQQQSQPNQNSKKKNDDDDIIDAEVE